MTWKPQSRRDFINTGLLTAGGLGLGFAAISNFAKKGAAPAIHPAFGPLSPVRDETTGLPLLMLPKGFRYHTFAWAGQTMSDGFATPGKADGMGVIKQDGKLVTLVRNHELRGSSGAFGNPDTAWDVVGGGTTNLVFDTSKEVLDHSFISLSGTLNNCGGGTTPWGTWLSCEEGIYSPDLAHHGIENRQKYWSIGNAKKHHGYVFEVGTDGLSEPEPIWDMGQFWHEAATVDPLTGIVYMTEDRSPHAGFYRYIPDVPGDLKAGGSLQMLGVEGVPELIEGIPLFRPMKTKWVDIPEPRNGHRPNSHDGKGVVTQGLDAGASAFRALEGCIWTDGEIYFTAKNSGAARGGYIFRLNLEHESIELILEAPARGGFSGPDNINISPRGCLVICEDREDGDLSAQYLAGLTDKDGLFAFSQINPLLNGTQYGYDLKTTSLRSEWAGVCYSADGLWMFVNVYNPGFTCAITGPWVEGLI